MGQSGDLTEQTTGYYIWYNIINIGAKVVGKIKVLIADDHALVLESLSRLLDNEEDIECVGLARDGEEAIKLVAEFLPDIAVLDVAMPKIDGIQALRRIKQISPGTNVLIISGFDYVNYILACIEAGATGYLLKTNLPATGFVNAIRNICAGELVFDREATAHVFRRLAKSGLADKSSHGDLCARELEILKLAVRGMSNKEIALKLVISEHTVATHFAHIFRKLQVESRIEAAFYAVKHGWVTIDDLGKNEISGS